MHSFNGEIDHRRTAASMLKMFMVSLILMGMIIGVSAAESLRPHLVVVWLMFAITAASFLWSARMAKSKGLRRKRRLLFDDFQKKVPEQRSVC
ncbi:MAG: hypothetical protein SGJ27_05985 [Candidatus Melainabacteria bacterium]|nr:hypothetical protein [Candidatus Melainabacteria bacterium]